MAQSCFIDHFDHLQDPRRDQGKRHRLDHILVIALCAVTAGAEGWDDIATFAKAKAHWLEKRLAFKHGPPSGDTVRRVLSTISVESFAQGFLRWIETVVSKTAGEVIAIDGKTLRRSYDKDDPKAALHMISAWASQQRLVLAQHKVDGKSNEIRAIPALLEVLDVAGCIVTLDAMGTQTEIAEQICAQGGDYVLALKGNQGKLHQEVREYFADGLRRGFAQMPIHFVATTDLGHGRKEVRRLWASSDVAWLPKAERWSNLRSIARLDYERHTEAGVAQVQRYYISSLAVEGPEHAQVLLEAARSHWGIENSVHWVLDVVFREDESRIRRDHGGENMALLRHLALNLLRHDQTKRLSLRMKRKRAGWDDAFLAQLIGI